MLQQTQTDRVIKKYEEWLTHFPTAKKLSEASLQEVLKHWQGLGYNRRALALKKAAQIITENKKFPETYEEILELPGIGPYTAGAIMAFAYNKPIPIIETNIRTVYIHAFFKNHGQPPSHKNASAGQGIHDKEILELVAKTLDHDNPRDWYHALMDYGVMLKKTVGNLNTKSKHYTKQTKFKGSNREIRATIVKIITESPVSEKSLGEKLEKLEIITAQDILKKNLSDLEHEGFIKKVGNSYRIN